MDVTGKSDEEMLATGEDIVVSVPYSVQNQNRLWDEAIRLTQQGWSWIKHGLENGLAYVALRHPDNR